MHKSLCWINLQEIFFSQTYIHRGFFYWYKNHNFLWAKWGYIMKWTLYLIQTHEKLIESSLVVMELIKKKSIEPGPIASDFFQTFWDFGIRRKLILFSLPLVNFTAEKCTIWKILMKMWLVMVTIIKLTQYCIGSCKSSCIQTF